LPKSENRWLMKEKLLHALKQYFGYSSFRPLQYEIISEILAGRDALAILPTGAGKSLCFQLPALVRSEITVVVSPLIALMKDQVDNLNSNGVQATFLNSSLTPSESSSRRRELIEGKYRILYVAPERLVLPDFMSLMNKIRVGLVAIDEAHCISAWGHDFRPEYRQLSTLREVFPQIPILALTATATARVRDDIATQLGLNSARAFSSTFNRPNLFYSVSRKVDAKRQIQNFIEQRPGESGIVYCFSRDAAEKLAAHLCKKKIKALVYHAGLKKEDRLKNQEAFARDEVSVICATVAFGMGIDKPNVRYVIHHDLPRNLESYYQETGRAGRDGLPSQCVLMYGPQDGRKIQYFINQMSGQERTIARRQLQQIEDFARQTSCRRKYLLAYFGETLGGNNCGTCDNCSDSHRLVDATIQTQKFLSCAYRMLRLASSPVAFSSVAGVLRGQLVSLDFESDYKSLSTFGIGSDIPVEYWSHLANELVDREMILADNNAHVIDITDLGLAALKERSPVAIAPPIETFEKPQKKSRKSSVGGDFNKPLFEALRTIRKQLAYDQGVPAFVIFGDRTLQAMARIQPTTLESLSEVYGIGESKLEHYGQIFIDAIKKWQDGNGSAQPSSIFAGQR
jgi:ATP-dependent DNA helicase RecQ